MWTLSCPLAHPEQDNNGGPQASKINHFINNTFFISIRLTWLKEAILTVILCRIAVINLFFQCFNVIMCNSPLWGFKNTQVVVALLFIFNWPKGFHISFHDQLIYPIFCPNNQPRDCPFLWLTDVQVLCCIYTWKVSLEPVRLVTPFWNCLWLCLLSPGSGLWGGLH